jgi:hypothetical protein
MSGPAAPNAELRLGAPIRKISNKGHLLHEYVRKPLTGHKTDTGGLELYYKNNDYWQLTTTYSPDITWNNILNEVGLKRYKY